MMNEQLIAKAIHLGKINPLFRRHIKPCKKEDLPSKSQWYRLKEYALTGDAKKIGEFLRERSLKKENRRSWVSAIVQGKAIHLWLDELFVKPVEEASDWNDLTQGKYRELGLSTDLPPKYLVSDFEDIKRVVLKMALCEFIDRILLFTGKPGLSYHTDPDNGRMEVKQHG